MRAAEVAEADQVRAAFDDAERVVRRLAAHHGLTAITRPTRVGWVGDLVAGFLGRAAFGGGRTCGHLEQPRPVFGAAWLGDLLLCAPCAAVQLRLTGEPDRTCDRCGEVVDLIRPGTVQAGPVIVFYGLCERCHRIVTLEQGPDRRGRKPRRETRRWR